MLEPSPHDISASCRIVDVNLNRASEGLRVVEEYTRFVMDDSFLTGELKQLRHDLTLAGQAIPFPHLTAARATEQDVGTALTTSAEYDRVHLLNVVQANMQRVQQALRTIEEYGKILSTRLAKTVEGLRYRCYTVHKALLSTATSAERMAQCRLYVLIDGGTTADDFTDRVQRLLATGVDAIQLRDKSLSDRVLLERAQSLRALTRGTPTLMIMNDRPDIAALTHADGVHVGQDELPVWEVRKIVGPQSLIGVSTHSIEQARRAVLEGANYLGCGPTFPSTTKSFSDFPGVRFLREVAAEISLPAFAIGGITAENMAEVLTTGMRRVAVSGAVTKANDLPTAVADLRRHLESSRLTT
jgi:thiamine-phosphate pyrophosphorylase